MPIDGLPGGDFDGCVREMTGKVDDPKGFCAWKIHELTGKWPTEESWKPQMGGIVSRELRAHLSPAHTVAMSRAIERVQLTDIEPGKGPYPGAIWNVTLIGPDLRRKDSLIEVRGKEYVYSQNGIPYAVEALRDNVHMFDGCKVYDNHLTDEEFEARGGMRSFGDELTGVIVNVKFDESAHKLRGQYRVGDRAYAQKLADFHELGILAESAGLSIDTFPVFADLRHEGKRLRAAVGFKKVNSTDVVTEPAAGGSLDRRIAATQIEEVNMSGFTDEQKEFISQQIAEALAAPDAEQVEEEVTAEEVGDVVMEEVAAIIEEAPADADPVEVAAAIADVVEEIAVEVEEVVAEEEEETAAESAMEARLRQVEDQLRLVHSDQVLGDALDAAKLGAMRPTVEAAFKGRLYAKGDLMQTIKRAKEAQAATDTSGQVRGAGGSVRLLNTRGSMNPRDQAMIGLMQMMAPRIPVIGSLRHVEGITTDYVRARQPEAMRAWINSGRGNYRPWDGKTSTWLQLLCGYNPLNIRAKEANDVSSITKDAINLFLAAAYDAKIEWWEPLVSTETVETIHDVTLVRDYGLSDLAIVAAGGPYVDQELSDDEETGSHIKHGNTISVTLEDLNKDRLDVLSRIPQKLATAWYNTKSTKAAAVFTVNSNTGPVLSDSGALFNNTATTSATGHENLLTAGLSFAAYGAARSAMRKQTDKKLGAGNRLLATPKFLLVPDELETTALQIRNSEYEPGGPDNDINPYYQKFDVVVVPDWTSDANDWAILADPMQFPVIYDIKVRGYEVPQVFTAGDESSGAVFTNDTWKWKVRLMTYRFSSTYDCMCVADFRGAHKNNV